MTIETAKTFSRRTMLAVALPAIAVRAAWAQDATANNGGYPNHQVTFIVPFAPAGGTDVLRASRGET